MNAEVSLQYPPIDVMRVPFPARENKEQPVLLVVLVTKPGVATGIRDSELPISELDDATWEDAECL